MEKITGKNDDVNHLYMIRVQKEFGTTRDKLFSKLLELGVSTSLHYKPLHKFTAYKKLAVIRKSLENQIIINGININLAVHFFR